MIIYPQVPQLIQKVSKQVTQSQTTLLGSLQVPLHCPLPEHTVGLP